MIAPAHSFIQEQSFHMLRENVFSIVRTRKIWFHQDGATARCMNETLNNIERKLTENEKLTEDNIKEAEFKISISC